MTTMTDDELRLAIAKAFGLTVYHYDKGYLNYYCLLESDGYPVNENHRENERATEAECWEKDCPNWPTDLNAAFELVEEAEVQNVGFGLCNVTRDDGKRITYEATFYDPWGGPACKKYTVEAKNPARAICEAWLQWKESEGQG
jgi:hypothetical protein